MTETGVKKDIYCLFCQKETSFMYHEWAPDIQFCDGCYIGNKGLQGIESASKRHDAVEFSCFWIRKAVITSKLLKSLSKMGHGPTVMEAAIRAGLDPEDFR